MAEEDSSRRDEETTILESRSTHDMRPNSGDARAGIQDGEMSSPSTTLQSELENLVSKLQSEAGTKKHEVLSSENKILSMQSKDDYEKLQDLLLSNKVVSSYESLAPEDIAEGLYSREDSLVAEPVKSVPYSYFNAPHG